MASSGVRTEYATRRKLRERNKTHYRLSHWPIWIAVFFLVPGPFTFELFAHGFDVRMAVWLGAVLLGTGVAGLLGKLPGCEPRPYIIRFTEDKPNPLYRRVCYTVAWSELLAYSSLTLAGMVYAVAAGKWRYGQLYAYGYFPVVVGIWILGAAGLLPRVKASTKGEGHERRYFYGMVWAVPVAQGAALVLWKTCTVNAATNWLKLAVYIVTMGGMGLLAVRGVLPRTRRIVPGELAISD